MIRNRFSRREFIGLSAAAAGASLGLKTILLDPDPLWALPQTVAPSDRVHFGMIGIGMQGSGLLASSIELPGVECVAACDLYDGRHTSGAKRLCVPTCPPPGAITNCWRTRTSIASSPPFPTTGTSRWWSTRSARARISTSKNPCRIPRAEGVEMVAAAKKNGRIVQSGFTAGQFRDLRQGEGTGGARSARRSDAGGRLARSQRSNRGLGVSAAARSFAADARLGYLAGNCAQAGLRSPDLCPLALLEGIRHRRGRRSAGSPGQRYAIRAGYQRGAAAGDGHGRNPALEGWHGTCRMCTALCSSTAKFPVYMRLNLGTESPEIYRFQGSKGILELTEYSLTYTPQAGVDTGPSYYTSGYPRAMREEYARKWHQEHDRNSGQGTGDGRHHLPQRFLGRGKTSSMELFSGSKDAQAGGRGCRIRSSRRTGLPHGEPILLPKERRDLGRGFEDHQKLKGSRKSSLVVAPASPAARTLPAHGGATCRVARRQFCPSHPCWKSRIAAIPAAPA